LCCLFSIFLNCIFSDIDLFKISLYNIVITFIHLPPFHPFTMKFFILKSKKMLPFILLCIIPVLLVALLIYGNITLTTTEITVTSERLPDSFSGFRIAHISDLHNTEFGRNNTRLLNRLQEIAPDIIVITGDIVDSRRTNMDIAISFATAATDIAPVFYVGGNHESRLENYTDLTSALTSVGVSVLDNKNIVLSRGYDTINLTGIRDPAFVPGEMPSAVIDTLLHRHLPTEETYSMVLCHRPELFDTYASHDIDLVFSGHVHGGQFRLPLIGGLFAPAQGFFPKYDSGTYSSGNTTMVVSRGLGNSLFPLRINNPPEIIVATLLSP